MEPPPPPPPPPLRLHQRHQEPPPHLGNLGTNAERRVCTAHFRRTIRALWKTHCFFFFWGGVPNVRYETLRAPKIRMPGKRGRVKKRGGEQLDALIRDARRDYVEFSRNALVVLYSNHNPAGSQLLRSSGRRDPLGFCLLLVSHLKTEKRITQSHVPAALFG